MNTLMDYKFYKEYIEICLSLIINAFFAYANFCANLGLLQEYIRHI